MTSRGFIEPVISYGKNREDIIIDAFFGGKTGGTYIDIGASHPIFNSSTKMFYLKGWSGLDIVSDKSIADLMKSDRPNDQVVVINHGSITISDNVDFIKIQSDISNKELLGDIIKKYQPELICTELNKLNIAGYRQFFDDGLNIYYAIKDSKRLNKFFYQNSVLDKYPVVVPFMPQAYKADFNESFFDEIESINQPTTTLVKDLVGALHVLNNSSRSLLSQKIINLKRQKLDSMIEQSISNGGDGKVGTVHYFGYKIIVLRLVLKLVSLFMAVIFRIGHKVKSGGLFQ